MTSIVYHSNCADGIVAKEMMRASAQYLNYPSIDFLPFQYGMNIMGKYLINSIWVDCCPEDEKDFLIGLQHNCIYIDHHETVKEKFQKHFSKFPDQLIFGETTFGHSGASLTYDYLIKQFRKKNVNPADINDFDETFYDIQKLATIADTWQSEHKDFSKARAMSSLIVTVGNEIDIPSCHNGLLKMALAYNKNKQKKDLEKANNIEVIGFELPQSDFSEDDKYLQVAIVNDNYISDIAEILRNREDRPADLIVGFSYIPKGNMYDIVYSLRSNDKFDCSKYAKSNDGGGHVKAAGFKVQASYFNIEFDPINYFRNNLTEYLNTIS